MCSGFLRRTGSAQDPSDGYRTGQRLLEEGRFSEADHVFRQTLATEEQPEKSALILNQLGVIQARMKKFPEARKFFEEALEQDPYLPAAYSNIGNIYYEDHRFTESIEWYRKALEVDDGYQVARMNLGAALKKTGQYDEAVRCFRRSNRFSLVGILGGMGRREEETRKQRG